MKSTKALGLAALLSLTLVACSKDELTPTIVPTETPLVVGQESIRVKVGVDNRVALDIQQGGGEYNVFTLHEEVAVATKDGDKIYVEGISNGSTSLVLSDKEGHYRRIAVSVYTTEQMTLQDTEVKLISKLGSLAKYTSKVLLGNGQYSAVSDSDQVSVSVDEETGEIALDAVSKLTPYQAKVTISDESGLKAEMQINVEASLEPYTDAELEEIKSRDNARYYVRDGSIYTTSALAETREDGKYVYGSIYEFWGTIYYDLHVTFSGDLTPGVKQDATLFYQGFSGVEADDRPVTVEIIKNDGTNLWIVYHYVDEEYEVLVYGYMCTPITVS